MDIQYLNKGTDMVVIASVERFDACCNVLVNTFQIAFQNLYSSDAESISIAARVLPFPNTVV